MFARFSPIVQRNCLRHLSYELRLLGMSTTIRILESRFAMFLILALVLVVLWLGGFTLFHVSGFLIHILLIFAVISIVMHFISGGRRA